MIYRVNTILTGIPVLVVTNTHDVHSVLVLQKNGNTLTVVEGNHNATVHWGRKITKKELQESGFYVETRY